MSYAGNTVVFFFILILRLEQSLKAELRSTLAPLRQLSGII